METTEQQSAKEAQNRGSWLTRLRSYGVFVPVVYLYTAVLGTGALIASLFDREGRLQHWFARTWASVILKTIGIRIRVEGLEHLPAGQAVVYAANHLSAVDIPVLYSSLPGQFRIMAKRELFRYPFLGWYLTRSGQIPIVYGDAYESLRSLNRAGDAVRKGTPLAVFPEGGRSQTGELQKFLGGAFFVAIRTQVPVIPVAIVGTYELLPMNSFHLLPGTVDLVIGKPIPTTGLRPRDMEKLAEQVRQAIAELYDSHAPHAIQAKADREPKALKV